MAYPLDDVVIIASAIGGQTFQASGVLISPDEVLTASHVVYSSTFGLATDVAVAPGYNAGNEPFGRATGTFVHYHPIQDGNDLIFSQQSQFDYAVVHLSHPFTGLGTMGLEANFRGGFVNVAGYPAALNGVLATNQQNMTVDPNFTLLDGTGIGIGSSGGPVWVNDSNGVPSVVGVVSSIAADGRGFFTQITTTAFNEIESWVMQDDHIAPPILNVFDTSTGQSVAASARLYAGPVGLQEQYINISSHNLNITVGTPNWFVHSGSGEDALQVSSGTNVLDGGTGSNFLTGGNGTDTFFVDDRGASEDIWSTVVGFHSGDAATIWGVTPQDFALNWANGEGAVGFTGLTLHATASNRPIASLTLNGYSTGDLSNGRLTIAFGQVGGNDYMLVHG